MNAGQALDLDMILDRKRDRARVLVSEHWIELDDVASHLKGLSHALRVHALRAVRKDSRAAQNSVNRRPYLKRNKAFSGPGRRSHKRMVEGVPLGACSASLNGTVA